MMTLSPVFSLTNEISDSDLPTILVQELKDTMTKVKKARRWFKLDSITKAFVKAFTAMEIVKIKSVKLMKAIVLSIKKMKEVLQETRIPLQAAIEEAWKISTLAASWGHPTSVQWKNNKSFIMCIAINLKSLSKLLVRII